jgi:RimJ/RimL family protein N-acetyltransferase
VATPEITTARLRLRGWRETDRDALAAMNGDPAVMEHFPAALDRAGSDAMLKGMRDQWQVEGFGLWAIERLDNGAFLGFAGLSRPNFEAQFTPAVEVGWRLARQAWGHGYATESAREALRFGFETLRLDEIVSFTVPANVRSRAVMERLGMTRHPVDDFDHPGLPAGHRLRGHVLYRLTGGAWRAARS